ncbi:hypothetical protein [Pseudomonas mosselii]|uniref:hypothetical protein n=1 Tax=Pseudomonas mosselii TaxID=78327 RepID=UPI000D8DAA73|nr:hypothetical protein [Pseudomonas mosselii]PYC22961.1 hypothetical protein DMX06_09895 [Pseudomonas mosselii]
MMSKWLLKAPYLRVSVVFVVALYVLCAVDNYTWVESSALKWCVTEQILSTNEDSFLEVLSALLWAMAFGVFCSLFMRSRSVVERCWLALYAAVSLFAFGEETSWGYHWFNYADAVPLLTSHNAQGETNLHNINVAEILGVSSEATYYYYLENVSHLLNPLFYLFLSGLWLGLPLVKMSGAFKSMSLLREMPVASVGFLSFFLIHSVLFIVVDVALFNVGFIYEMFIALAAVLVGLDITRTHARLDTLELRDPALTGAAVR